MLLAMGLLQWIKTRFRKDQSSDLTTKVTFLKLSHDIHTDTLHSIIESLKTNDEFRSMVANAVTNIDNRVDHLEKMTTFLYEKTNESGERLDSLEERITKDEFHNLVTSLTPKS